VRQRTEAKGPGAHAAFVTFQASCSGPALCAHGRSFFHARDAFDSPFIPSSGFHHTGADHALLDKRGDLIAIRRPLLTNPDLVVRRRHDVALNAPVEPSFSVPRPKGYTESPTLAA
jgi:N-ethylmaleimide reductase